MSLNVIKAINNNKIAIPIRFIYPSTFLFTGRLIISSIISINTLPPSRAGKGIRFIIPRFMASNTKI